MPLDLINDAGEFVVIGGVAYHKTGSGNAIPDPSPQPGDLINQSAQVYTIPDAQGKTDYTGCEQMIAHDILGVPAQSVGGTYNLVFTAPTAGVVRFQGLNWNTPYWGVNFNGVRIIDRSEGKSISSSIANAEPFNVAQGDEIELYSDSTSNLLAIFLPFVYPFT